MYDWIAWSLLIALIFLCVRALTIRWVRRNLEKINQDGWWNDQ